jgi:hypothetical protein
VTRETRLPPCSRCRGLGVVSEVSAFGRGARIQSVCNDCRGTGKGAVARQLEELQPREPVTAGRAEEYVPPGRRPAVGPGGYR